MTIRRWLLLLVTTAGAGLSAAGALMAPAVARAQTPAVVVVRIMGVLEPRQLLIAPGAAVR